MQKRREQIENERGVTVKINRTEGGHKDRFILIDQYLVKNLMM